MTIGSYRTSDQSIETDVDVHKTSPITRDPLPRLGCLYGGIYLDSSATGAAGFRNTGVRKIRHRKVR